MDTDFAIHQTATLSRPVYTYRFNFRFSLWLRLLTLQIYIISVTSSRFLVINFKMANEKDMDGPAKRSIDKNSDKMPVASQSPSKKSFRFWAIIATLSIAGNLTALEATIVTTALPTIIADLNGADKYLWVANAYLLSM